ncbi:tectonic-1 [Procambarus clarkii]|uniref:tectonic-1 n=1 Tax=Procambarus clarkii TaxID=6728 RepID=UPI003742BC54
MLSRCLYLGLIFSVLYIKPFHGENDNLNVENTDRDKEDITEIHNPSNESLPSQNDKELFLPENAVQVDITNPIKEDQFNTGINVTLITPSNITLNESDIDYEFNDNNTLAEMPNETTAWSTNEVPTTPSPLYESDLVINDFCLCDLKVHFCDINCCCDEDCNADDRKVFSHCHVRPQNVLDTRYCFQRHTVFSNHTEYKVEHLQNGLFCIITDNLPQRTTYVTVKGATSVEEYQQLERGIWHYSWESSYQTLQFDEVSYSAGSAVWAVNKEGFLFNIGIPDSLFGSECETLESLSFLEDSQSSCNRVFHNVAEECENKIDINAINFLILYVVADPGSLNQNSRTTTNTESTKSPSFLPPTSTITPSAFTTDEEIELTNLDENKNHTAKAKSAGKLTKINYQNWKQLTSSGPSSIMTLEPSQDSNYLSEDQLLPIKVFLCFLDNNEENCTETDINDMPQPVYTVGVCENVALSIHYIFLHNGTEGIFQVQAKVYLTNVANTMTYYKQSFHVKYIWASVKDETAFKRSGHPGYIIGKPILLGKLVDNVTEEGEMKEAIYLDTNPRQWLTVLAPGKEGKCNSRSQVTFGIEMRTGCIVQVKQDDLKRCKVLQNYFIDLLLGPILRDPSKLRIGTFGDSSINNAADWIPILIPEEPRSGPFSSHVFGKRKCSDIILSLHIEIAYSLQGALANPQAKVVGIVLHYGEPQSIDFSCASLVCQNAQMKNSIQVVELISSVSFVEVTLPPQPAYSKPPALDAKLPYNFFYPFLPSSAPANHVELMLVWTFLQCIVCILY